MPRYLLLLVICFFASLLSAAGDNPMRVGLARLQYDGGGDWYNDPEVLPNLAKYAATALGTSFPVDQAVVKASGPQIFDYPFVYLTGHGNIRFSDKEVETLRDWMLRGGFLYADDDYGMDASFRREIKRIFPERELVELDSGYPLMNCFFPFPSGIPKIHLHDEKAPQAFGIFADDGRLLCLYTYETNISDGWADPATHNDPPEIREKALRFGVNILYYVLQKWTNP